MKAIRVHETGAPEVMRLEEVPDPRPEAGEILVRIRAIGVNPVDTYLRAGSQGYRPELPYTPGRDAAGEVEAVGPGVEGRAPGDRVYISGTLTGAYAEKALCRAEQVRPLPENVSFAAGASLGVPYATAYHALFQRAGALPGEVVLIHGASGGVGTAAVQWAAAAGLTVVGTAGSERGRELVIGQGATAALDHHDPGHLEEARKLAGERGIGVIVEFLANVHLAGDLAVLGQGGRIVVVGSRGKVEIDPRDLMGAGGAVLGLLLLKAGRKQLAAIDAAIQSGLRTGTLRPVIGRQLPLAEAARAHHAVMEEPAYGKIVLMP